MFFMTIEPSVRMVGPDGGGTEKCPHCDGEGKREIELNGKANSLIDFVA
jgi:hypothetical protein